MSVVLVAALAAVLVWWLGTGALLLLVRQPRARHRRLLFAATLVLLAALMGLVATRTDTSVVGALLAFVGSVTVWAWVELTFLLGVVTGPRTQPSPLGARGWRRFGAATAAIIHHELLLVLAGAVVAALTWNSPNPVASWTFAVLWTLRLSAKLNLFLGVRNHFGEFLPAHLRYLESYFRRRPVNLLFPVVVSVATGVAAVLWHAALTATAAFDAAAYALTATLLSLAVLEHWFLVLPLPAAALWQWSLRREAAAPDSTQFGN